MLCNSEIMILHGTYKRKNDAKMMAKYWESDWNIFATFVVVQNSCSLKRIVMKAVISIDWLSLYMKGAAPMGNSEFTSFKTELETANFTEVWEIYEERTGEKFGMLQRCPRSKILPHDAVIFKLENRVLYTNDWGYKLNSFLIQYNYQVQSISRIDLCADFNEFENGLSCQDFIYNIVTRKYLKMGKCKAQLMLDLGKMRYEDGIRFGSRDNDLCYYLYNKTKEMKEKTYKPYIMKLWEDSGLDISRPVWRLEFSMKTTSIRAIVVQTGEMFRIDIETAKQKPVIDAIYQALLNRYFDFRINDGQKKKNRMAKVCLFGHVWNGYEVKQISHEAKTNRTDRIIIKKLANMEAEYRINEADEAADISRAIKRILDATDLWDYYEKQVKPFIQRKYFRR